MSREDGDGIFTFLAGMTLGMLGGAVAGLLFAPKPGNELRADAQDFISTLPGRLNDELKNPNARTREFIERTRYNIEAQVGKVKRSREAERQAKAKQAEELAAGYEFN